MLLLQALPKTRSVRRREREHQHSAGVTLLAGSGREPSTAQHTTEHRLMHCTLHHNYVCHFDKNRKGVVPWIFGPLSLMIRKIVMLPFISFISWVRPHLCCSFTATWHNTRHWQEKVCTVEPRISWLIWGRGCLLMWTVRWCAVVLVWGGWNNGNARKMPYVHERIWHTPLSTTGSIQSGAQTSARLW